MIPKDVTVVSSMLHRVFGTEELQAGCEVTESLAIHCPLLVDDFFA